MSAVPAIEWLRLPGFDANSKTLHRAQLAGDCLRSVMDSKWTMIYTDTALEVRSGDLVCIHAYNRAGHYGRMIKELRVTKDFRWWAWSDDGIFQIGRLIRPVAIFRVVGLSADGYKRPPSGPGATPKDHETFARLAGDAVAEWARDGYPKGVLFPGVDAVNIPDPTRAGRPVILSGAVNATVDTPTYDEPDAPINFTVSPTIDGVHLSWGVPIPVKRDQTYHVYEYTAITPFSSATRVWSGKTTQAVINRLDVVPRYYWVTSELNGMESSAVPVGNGTAASGFLNAQQRICPDAEVGTSDPTLYWSASNAKATVANTGGLVGGIITLTGNGAAPNPEIKPQRPGGLLQASLGMSVKCRMRYRRTTTLTTTDASNPSLHVRLFSYATVSGGSNNQQDIEAIDLSGLTLNVWEETSFTLSVSVNCATAFGAARPFVNLLLDLDTIAQTGFTTGTVEVDLFDAVTL